MRLFFIASFILPFTFAATAQSVKYIQIKQQPVSYAPKGFYVSDVKDDLADRSGIGEINDAGKKQKIALQSGTAPAIKNFIEHNVTQDKSTQAVVLHISKMDVDVKRDGSAWNVEASATMTFYVGDKKVVEYNGKGHGQMDQDPGDYIEGFIRMTIENDLKRFDSWWAQNKGNVATESSVKVNVVIGKTTNKPNCIVYSLQRPLSIGDFTGPVEEEIPELAATFSGIGLLYAGQTQNGQLVLNVTITPYFERTKSWFKQAGKNPRVLAHEQAHFDITAIKACELAETIRKTAFTQDNYEKLIDELQRQNAQASNDEESAYDTETNHGTIEDKQLEWERKIKARVKEIACY